MANEKIPRLDPTVQAQLHAPASGAMTPMFLVPQDEIKEIHRKLDFVIELLSKSSDTKKHSIPTSKTTLENLYEYGNPVYRSILRLAIDNGVTMEDFITHFGSELVARERLGFGSDEDLYAVASALNTIQYKSLQEQNKRG
jgi:hypothetical protein